MSVTTGTPLGAALPRLEAQGVEEVMLIDGRRVERIPAWRAVTEALTQRMATLGPGEMVVTLDALDPELLLDAARTPQGGA